MTSSELESRNIAISMRKSVENLVISSQDAIGQHISQALTFTDVITQQQIIHENRSVSRSPSPSPSISLRNPDGGIDSLEQDKISESSITSAWPGAGAGDSGSVSSSELSTVLSAPVAAHVRFQGPGGTVVKVDAAGARSKKKSWYNALYPTYKSKSDDFKRLFKELPDDERLIVDYACALHKDILAQGRLYASQNYLCFYANILGWETCLTLRWKDVTAITKEKTAIVIPNAILVCTEGEKNFLTSFTGRDKAYLMLFRIWQNALMDQPMSSQEFWQWVHRSYGEELGFNSDEEGYNREHPEDLPSLPPDNSEDQLDSSMEAGGAESRDEPRSRPASRIRDSLQNLTNGDSEYRDEEAGDILPTDMSDTSDSEPEKPHDGDGCEKCTASHEGKLLLRQEVPFNIDEMFTMIFTNSKFNLELLAARRTTDYVQEPWKAQGGLKCRQISYTLGLTSGPIGPKEVQVTETQLMNKCSKPGVQYSIDCTSENAGIPYAEYFSVEVHYCLVRVSESVTEIALYGYVKYKKTMWPMVKTFLEKNTMSGLEEFARLLEARLRAEAEGTVPTVRKSRRHRHRLTTSSQESSAPTVIKSPAAGLLAPRASVSHMHRPAGTNRWLLGILLLLLLINAVLYWKLYHADKHHYTVHIEDLQNSVSGSQMADWSKLLEQHSARQRGQLLAWKEALDRTVAHLMQTEQALSKLLESIKPSLEKAQRDAEPREDL